MCIKCVCVCIMYVCMCPPPPTHLAEAYSASRSASVLTCLPVAVVVAGDDVLPTPVEGNDADELASD